MNFAAQAQFGHPLKGQWSGQWGPANNSTRLLLDLHWDGKEITGVINPGVEAATVKSVTFDYTDPSAWVDTRGVVFYKDEVASAPAQDGRAGGTSSNS